MMLFFSTRCYFFHLTGVNPYFLLDRVKKNNDVVKVLHHLEQDDANLWHSVKIIHRPSVNRFDGVILLYDFDYQKQSYDTTKL